MTHPILHTSHIERDVVQKHSIVRKPL